MKECEEYNCELVSADRLELTIDPDIIRCELRHHWRGYSGKCRRKASQRFQCLGGSGLGMNSHKLHFRVFVLDEDSGSVAIPDVQKHNASHIPT